jgi:hypothetical protein
MLKEKLFCFGSHAFCFPRVSQYRSELMGVPGSTGLDSTIPLTSQNCVGMTLLADAAVLNFVGTLDDL